MVVFQSWLDVNFFTVRFLVLIKNYPVTLFNVVSGMLEYCFGILRYRMYIQLTSLRAFYEISNFRMVQPNIVIRHIGVPTVGHSP